MDREKERKRSRKDEKRSSRRSAREGSSGGSDSEAERVRVDPESVLRNMLSEFPGVAGDLKQVKFCSFAGFVWSNVILSE